MYYRLQVNNLKQLTSCQKLNQINLREQSAKNKIKHK